MIAGLNGQIEILDEAVVIHRRGIGASIYHKRDVELVIPYASILRLQYQKTGWIADGFIYFDDGSLSVGHSFNPYKDKRTVTFKKSQASNFERLRDDVSQRLRKISLAPPRGRPMGVADEIAKLSRLVSRNLLTPAEFEKQKAKLLGQSR